MPFRSKLKKAFGGGSSEPSTNGGIKNDNDITAAIAKKEKAAKKHRWNQKTKEWDDWPEHIYKPYEIPAPKYKRAPAKEHTKTLEKFTWDAGASPTEDRRTSAASQYSPMGSKLPSRRSSQLGPGEGLPSPRSPTAAAANTTEEDEDPLGPTGTRTNTAVVQGVDPADRAADEDGGPLAPVDTVRPAPAPAASKTQSASTGDVFDSADLTRALTAIHDGNASPAAPQPTTAAAVGA